MGVAVEEAIDVDLMGICLADAAHEIFSVDAVGIKQIRVGHPEPFAVLHDNDALREQALLQLGYNDIQVCLEKIVANAQHVCSLVLEVELTNGDFGPLLQHRLEVILGLKVRHPAREGRREREGGREGERGGVFVNVCLCLFDCACLSVCLCISVPVSVSV